MITFLEKAEIIDIDNDFIEVSIDTIERDKVEIKYLYISEAASIEEKDALALADYIYRNFKRA